MLVMSEIILKLKHYKNYDLASCLQKCLHLKKKKFESVKTSEIAENL